MSQKTLDCFSCVTRLKSMPYRLELKAALSKELKALVVSELTSAADALAARTHAPPDKAIHEARKSLKKSRAVLRLIRQHLGNRYSVENRLLREAGRGLSERRDADALLETFDQLQKHHASELPAQTVRAVRRSLVDRKQTLQPAPDGHFANPAILRSISQAAAKVSEWRLPGGGFLVLATGLERSMRQARRAMRRAQSAPAPERYHEWRKRVKDHWYQMRLLENLWPEMMKPYATLLKNLETMLGEDQNLEMLRNLLVQPIAEETKKATVSGLLSLISESQHRLRQASLALGLRIYGEKPSAFVDRLERLWTAREQESDESSSQLRIPAKKESKAR